MLAIAALVPDTALLVPGAAGRASVLPEVRRAAVDAAGELVRARPDRVVVVSPGPADRRLAAPLRPSLAAAGIDDATLGWSIPDAGAGAGEIVVPAIGAGVALLLLAHAGWTGPVTVAEVASSSTDPTRAAALRALGAELVAGPDRTALLVAGSLGARHGPHAPAAEDDRAAPFDTATLADLALGDPLARQRLAQIPAELAAELLVSGWAPLQVLVGAAGDAAPYAAEVRHASAPLGVTYAVAVWRGVQP
ncbi:hypothetical protein [Pengzhenrongella frigida]|uniref:Extradiol ring-cleavage dioxygenase class III enzyme subunit B domain-containing protein n=1 Tax=Pengzhenrongella frigida TaxID=1259133 RepID=A0A4V1ZHL4_9MICO|nr:hypothetical protein [Cellulomonas sp. HLT2-17]RYV52454.1 hypothetical protein EUA98_03050 [Cellulomonas sp. HLT2-17]